MARIEIMHFAEAMEFKLAANDEKKGKQGWRKRLPGGLCDHLSGEVRELRKALNTRDVRRIMEECADVANMAMMIFDNQRIALEAEQREISRGKARVDGRLHDGPMDQ